MEPSWVQKLFHAPLSGFVRKRLQPLRTCQSSKRQIQTVQTVTNQGLEGMWKQRKGSQEIISSVQFSHSVVSDTLRPHGSQYARPPCPSQTPGVYTNSCHSSRLFHPAISSSVVPFSSCPQSLPASQSFPMSQLFAWGAKVLEFQLQHQSFQWTPRTSLLQDGLVGSPCSPRDSQESSPTPQFKSIKSSALSFLHSPTLTSIHDHWKNHSLDQTDICWQNNVSAF